MTDIFQAWGDAKRRADPRARQAVEYAEEKGAVGVLGGAGAGLGYLVGDEVVSNVKDFALGAKDYVEEQAGRIEDTTGMSVGINPEFNPTDSTITPKLDMSKLNDAINAQAQATLGNEGVQDYNIQGQYNIPNSNFNVSGQYGNQGGQVGAGYNNEGFSAGVTAPIDTNRVSDMLEKLRVGMNYTRKF